jgi:hypothetical protein
VPAAYSVRQSPQVIGMGLLEALDESTILALADPDDRNGDGIRGVPNWSIDPETGRRHLGRFGWKAGKGSVRQQAGLAFLTDMGVTSSVYKVAACQKNPIGCNTATATPSVSSQEMDRLASYLQLLGVPAQRGASTAGFTDGIVIPPEHVVDPVAIERGKPRPVARRATFLNWDRQHPSVPGAAQPDHPSVHRPAAARHGAGAGRHAA